jgi:hypothetical protein
MKIINKSGNECCDSEDTFYVVLYKQYDDYWEGGSFRCSADMKYATEEVAISYADPGGVVAKVTLVAKIV